MWDSVKDSSISSRKQQDSILKRAVENNPKLNPTLTLIKTAKRVALLQGKPHFLIFVKGILSALLGLG